MKRIICSILVLLFVFACFAACSEKDPNTGGKTDTKKVDQQTNTPTTTVEPAETKELTNEEVAAPYLESLGDTKYNRDFNILCMQGVGNSEKEIWVENASDEPIDNAVFLRNSAVYDRFGVTITPHPVAPGTLASEVQKDNKANSHSYDLIMANATPALQAAANGTQTIPVLGTSITEYGVALSINNFNGVTGINVSGTSDLPPLDTQAQMMIDLFPDAGKFGLLFCSAEANSKYQVDVVKAFLESKGKTATLFPFSDSNDIQTIMNKACAESDVIFVPSDNTAAASGEILNTISRETKTPIFAGEEGICKSCGTFTLSISYYGIGQKTGEMAVKILRDGADVSKMPIDYDANPVKKYNKDNCEFFGITVPEGYTVIE